MRQRRVKSSGEKPGLRLARYISFIISLSLVLTLRLIFLNKGENKVVLPPMSSLFFAGSNSPAAIGNDIRHEQIGELLGQIVSHAVYSQEPRPNQRFGEVLSILPGNEKIIFPMNDEYRHIDRAQASAKIGRSPRRGELSCIAIRIVGPVQGRGYRLPQIIVAGRICWTT